MKRLLIINPNTSTSVSALLQHHVSQAVSARGASMEVQTVTARFGAPYIADEVSYQVGGHAVLDAWANALTGQGTAPHGVMIGCFGDPGLWALRECCPLPVIGLAEAAFAEAASRGPFAVVTGGQRWGPMLHRLAMQLGFGAQLAGVLTVAPSGAEMAEQPEQARRLLAQACRDVQARWSVQSIIVGGAGLAGMAALLQPGLETPLIDSVQAASKALIGQIEEAHPTAPTHGPDLRYVGLPGNT
jgi:Asp/Glu/hydantoin racemase